MRDRLDELGLESFVKTHGRQGAACRRPGRAVARTGSAAKAFTAVGRRSDGARSSPTATSPHVASARGAGASSSTICATAAARPRSAAYSTRALPRASVSTPLAWDELSEGLRSDHFTLGNMRHRLDALKEDPWPGFFEVTQRIWATAKRTLMAGGSLRADSRLACQATTWH